MKKKCFSKKFKIKFNLFNKIFNAKKIWAKFDFKYDFHI